MSPSRKSNYRRRLFVLRLLVVAGAVLLIEALCRWGVISPRVLVPPSVMAAELLRLTRTDTLWSALGHSASAIASAFVLAVLSGFLLGVLLFRFKRVQRVLSPLLTSYYAIPTFAFYPLFIYLFGLNNIPLILMGYIFAVVAMIISTINGLNRIPQVFHMVAAVQRLTRFQRIYFILLPAALPYFFSGIKLALAYSFIGVLAGEFIMASHGIGFQIANAYTDFATRKMYAYMLLVLILVAILSIAINFLQSRLLHRQAAG